MQNTQRCKYAYGIRRGSKTFYSQKYISMIIINTEMETSQMKPERTVLDILLLCYHLNRQLRPLKKRKENLDKFDTWLHA